MEVMFEIPDVFGDRVRLTRKRWNKLLEKHGEWPKMVDAFGESGALDLIVMTISWPDRVYEGLSAPDSKVFYTAQGAVTVPGYRNCRVAVVVRYTNPPGSISTTYFPVRISGNRGSLLYPQED